MTTKIYYQVYHHDKLLVDTYTIRSGTHHKEMMSELRRELKNLYKPLRVSIRTQIPKERRVNKGIYHRRKGYSSGV